VWSREQQQQQIVVGRRSHLLINVLHSVFLLVVVLFIHF
jgi:hypothetical protein